MKIIFLITAIHALVRVEIDETPWQVAIVNRDGIPLYQRISSLSTSIKPNLFAPSDGKSYPLYIVNEKKGESLDIHHIKCLKPTCFCTIQVPGFFYGKALKSCSRLSPLELSLDLSKGKIPKQLHCRISVIQNHGHAFNWVRGKFTCKSGFVPDLNALHDSAFEATEFDRSIAKYRAPSSQSKSRASSRPSRARSGQSKSRAPSSQSKFDIPSSQPKSDVLSSLSSDSSFSQKGSPLMSAPPKVRGRTAISVSSDYQLMTDEE